MVCRTRCPAVRSDRCHHPGIVAVTASQSANQARAFAAGRPQQTEPGRTPGMGPGIMLDRAAVAEILNGTDRLARSLCPDVRRPYSAG
jgi:hypothetical protein